MRTIAIIAGLALSLALAACGGGDDREEVSELFKRLEAAQLDGDAETACEAVFVVMEPWEQASEEEGEGEAESEEEREAEGEGEEETGEESPAACFAAFEASEAARDQQVSALHTTVESVAFEGDTAVASVRSEVTRTDGSTFANTYERDLVRRDGAWRIRISPEG